MNMEGRGDDLLPKAMPDNVIAPPRLLELDDEIDDDDHDEDIDETLSERLWGLTEMFPERFRDATSVVYNGSWNLTKWSYTNGRSLLWVLASSAAILALPIMFESERAQMEEQQIAQQRQIMLGPNAAIAGGITPGSMPQIAPPGQR